MNRLLSLMSCYFLDKFFTLFSIERSKSNIISCIFFQIFICYKSLLFLLFSSGEKDSANSILDQALGYFMYDLYILSTSDLPKKEIYIIHHLISCLSIYIVTSLKEWNYFYGILFLFLAESTGPFLNMNHLLTGNSVLKKNNIKFLKYYFFICRIILLPLCMFKFSSSLLVDNNVLYFIYTGFVILYLMNVFWWYKILRKSS